MKVYVTGSNANLLSARTWDQADRRYLQVEVFPYSFYEWVLGQKPHSLNPNYIQR